MVSGVIFCGTDIETFGLEYVPDNANTFVHRSSDISIHEQAFEAHDGGYFYGFTSQPKPFTLRCIFQESHINQGVQDKITAFFKPGKSGKLIFKHRPWVWYVATVTGNPVFQISNYQNGIVTLQFKAYYPYGRSDTNHLTDEHDVFAKQLTGFIDKSIVPSVEIIPNGDSLTASKQFLLYNSGSAAAPVAVEIAGYVGSGVTITNTTNNQKMRFVAISKEATSEQRKYVVTDSLNGKTIVTDGSTHKPAFLYHDYGFITLEPSYPIARDVHAVYISGSATIDCSNIVIDRDIIGKHIFANGQWRKIVDVTSDGKIVVDSPISTSGEEETVIVLMNEMIVEAESIMDLSRLNFVYNPTFT